MNLFTRARLIVVGAVLALGVMAAPAVTYAQEELAPVTTEGAGSTYVLSPFIAKTIIGIVLPFLIALILKSTASDKVKGAVGIVVAAVSALVLRWQQLDGSLVMDQAALQDIFHVYGTQFLVYYNLYKRLDLNSKLAPNFGIG
jgi:hypothetical protein